MPTMETLKSEAAAAIGNFVSLDDSNLVFDEKVYYDAEATVYKSDFPLSEDYETDDCLDPLPVAAATLLEPLISPADEGERFRLHSYDPADPTVDEVISYSRPEFIFASALVNDLDGKFGIFLRSLPNGGTCVVRLAKYSPFHNCNIEPGDHVVAVNNVMCSRLSARQVAKLMHASKGKVSICFQNQQGDPLSVSCSVQKPCSTSKVGVYLRSKRGAIRVSRLDLDGLFGNSLLEPHHRCMMINGVSCNHMTTRTAGDVILAAADRVTIVSRPEANYALTIALCSPTNWRRNALIGAGAAAGVMGVLSSLS